MTRDQQTEAVVRASRAAYEMGDVTLRQYEADELSLLYHARRERETRHAIAQQLRAARRAAKETT